jgi:MtrB/PioB family decaheme-associated outer membrane protein
MKSHKNTAFKISTLSAALLSAYGSPVLAQDADLSQWVKPEMSVTVGAGFQDNERPQLGIFDGRRDNTAKLLLDADITHRDDATGTWNQLRISNFGLDNRELEFSHSRQGDYGVSFEYSRIPRETPYTVNTGLQVVGDNQTVKVVVPGSGPRNIELGTNRDRYTFGLNKIIEGVLDGSLDLTVKYRQEEKDGKRHFGSYSGAQAIFLIEPVNSTTRQLDIGLSYVGKDLQLQGGYYGSWYENANSLINVTTATLTRVYVSLPPDNQSYQFYVNGAYALSPTTKATMRLARTTATQDDYSLLSSLPPALVWAGYDGVKAKVVTKDAQFGITSKPIKDLSLLANYTYQDRDDRTPHVPYNSQAVPDETTPHSFTNKNAKLEATYRFLPGFKVLGGAYLDTRERSIPFKEFNNKPATPTNAGGNWTVPLAGTNEREVPYRHKTDELTFKVQATKNILDELNGSLTFSHANRDGSNFYWADMQNLVNPLHMSDRERDKAGLKLDWSPLESLSLQAQFSQARDDYDSNGLNAGYVAPNGRILSGTGITDGKAKLFSLDADFKLNDSWQLTAWYSRDKTEASQRAFQANFGPTPMRTIELSDTGDSFGVGIKGKATANITLGADLEWNKSVGKYQQGNVRDAGATLEEGLPDITNKTLRIALNGAYQLDKKSSVRLDVVYDRWDTDDWSWMMWNNAKTALVPMAYATDGTSASVGSRQSSSFVAVRYKYDF